MSEVRTLGPKGQIVIPKAMREILGLKRGYRVVFELKNQQLRLRAEGDPEKFVEEFCGVVNKKLKNKIDLKKLYESELEERYGL